MVPGMASGEEKRTREAHKEEEMSIKTPLTPVNTRTQNANLARASDPAVPVTHSFLGFELKQEAEWEF